MKLINISNHPAETWTNEQKAGWDIIIDIPFPEVDPNFSTQDIADIATDIINDIMPFIDGDTAVYIAGDYSLSYALVLRLIDKVRIVVPTTKRIIKDGVRVFKFVRWRDVF